MVSVGTVLPARHYDSITSERTVVGEQELARTDDGGTTPTAGLPSSSTGEQSPPPAETTLGRLRRRRHSSRLGPASTVTACRPLVRAIDTALEHGWIDCDYSDPEVSGPNALVANVFFGGSITRRDYQPSVVVTSCR